MKQAGLPAVLLSVLFAACGGGETPLATGANIDLATGTAADTATGTGTGADTGTSNDTGTVSPTETCVATPVSGTSTGTATGASTAPSSAAIVFPWLQSASLGNSVVVQGETHDPDGVAGVSVNGIPAVITPAPDIQQSSGQTGGTAPDSSTGGQSQTEPGDPTDVEWECEIDLEHGDNDIVVDVEDSTGDVTTGADQVRVRYFEVPSIFTSDAGDPRLVGWSTSLTQSGLSDVLVSFDHASGMLTVYPELSDIGVASCLRGSTNEFLYLTRSSSGAWQLRSFDLATRQTLPVSDIAPQLIDSGIGFSNGPLLMQLVCSSAREQAYLLANYWENGNSAKSRILKIELSGAPASMLTETDAAETTLWLARRIALAGDALVGLYDIAAAAPLSRIGLLDGARSALAAIDVGGLAMAAALDLNRVYVTTLGGVELVDLSVDPPVKNNISVVAPADPLNFSQAESIALDFAGNRVIVGDSDLDMIVAVDHDTGARTELLSRNIGAGPHMIRPRRLQVSAGDAFAYVLDDGGNAPERLFEIDLATGNRRVVGQIHDGTIRSITGIALNEQDGHVYVSRYDGGTVLQVDLVTEQHVAITDTSSGLLLGITDILFDAPNRRLLIADAETDAIVAVNVDTRQQDLISRAGSRGTGEGFTYLASLTMSGDGGGVYAVDQGTDRVFHVDLATGNRQVVNFGCAFGSAVNLRQVLYDGARNALLVLAEPSFAVDLNTSACSAIPMRLFPLGIDLTESGALLAVGFHALEQIEPRSGDVVVISQ